MQGGDFAGVTSLLPACELPGRAATKGRFRCSCAELHGYHRLIPIPAANSEAAASRLRAHSTGPDGRLVGRVLLSLAMATLAISSGLLFVAGAEKNSSITRLRQEAVPVEMTVGGCRGLLGGSGSNPVGYSCWGTFTLAGRTYRDGIPGDALLAPGRRLAMLSVPGDPGLVDTPQAVAAAHPSDTVYVLPAVLLGVLVAAVAWLALRPRRAQPALRAPFGPGPASRLGEVAGGV